MPSSQLKDKQSLLPVRRHGRSLCGGILGCAAVPCIVVILRAQFPTASETVWCGAIHRDASHAIMCANAPPFLCAWGCTPSSPVLVLRGDHRPGDTTTVLFLDKCGGGAETTRKARGSRTPLGQLAGALRVIASGGGTRSGPDPRASAANYAGLGPPPSSCRWVGRTKWRNTSVWGEGSASTGQAGSRTPPFDAGSDS